MNTFSTITLCDRICPAVRALTLLGTVVFLLCTSPAMAEGSRGSSAQSRGHDGVEGWRLGGDHGRGGYDIYRREHDGWRRIPGSGIQLGGQPDSPWLINSQYEIYRWTGNGWQRVRGSAIDVADGWVIGTDRRSGGYGIYRWNGRQFQRMPGAAVEIGGSYEQPWVINDRGERLEWTGRDWRKIRSRASHNTSSRWTRAPAFHYRDSAAAGPWAGE